MRTFTDHESRVVYIPYLEMSTVMVSLIRYGTGSQQRKGVCQTFCRNWVTTKVRLEVVYCMVVFPHLFSVTFFVSGIEMECLMFPT